jgi:hypothetical protein
MMKPLRSRSNPTLIALLLVKALQNCSPPIPRNQFCPSQTPFSTPVIACGPSGSVWEAVWGSPAPPFLVGSPNSHYSLSHRSSLRALSLSFYRHFNFNRHFNLNAHSQLGAKKGRDTANTVVSGHVTVNDWQ